MIEQNRQLNSNIHRRQTRHIEIGGISIGIESPISVQSMCATKTSDVESTLSQIESLVSVGADIVRIAVDSDEEARALEKIRDGTDATLSVDLQ